MYNPNYFDIQNNGWTCSKCGRSYAPYVQECVYCNSRIIKYLNSTKATPEWIYKEDTKTGSYPSYAKYESTTIGDILRRDYYDNENLWGKPL